MITTMISNIKFVLLSIIAILSSNYCFATDQFDSLSIQGTFKQTTAQLLKENFPNYNQTVKSAKDMIAEYNNNNAQPIYLTCSKENNLHISIACIEPINRDQKLTKTHCNTLVDLTHQHLDLEQGYTGNFYGIYLFANGYDQNGKKVNKHYKSYNTANQYIQNHYSNGTRLIQAHIVVRFGTNLTQGQDGKDGKLKLHASALLANITQNQQAYGFKDSYEGKEYTSHLTVACVKSNQGTPNATWPTLDYNQVLKTYNHFSQKWNKPQNLYTLDLVSLSAEVKSPKRHFLTLGQMDPIMSFHLGNDTTHPFILRSGFSYTENSHRWIDGYSAKLEVNLDHFQKCRIQKITFNNVGVFAPQGLAQNIIVKTSHDPVGQTYAFNQSEGQQIEVKFPHNVAGMTTVEFVTPNALSPSSFGFDDRRVTGLSLRDVKVQTAPRFF